jgi:hypothetical protein
MAGDVSVTDGALFATTVTRLALDVVVTPRLSVALAVNTKLPANDGLQRTE